MSVRNNLSNEIRLAAPVVVTNKEKIAYQGIKGANSYEAAQRLFPESDLTAYKSFDDVFKAVEDGECVYGVLPVENSTAGSVAAVYDLILRYRFYIVGALDLSIDYCLAGLKQSTLGDIEKVISHPQALSQCEQYISRMGYESTACSNTAGSASLRQPTPTVTTLGTRCNVRVNGWHASSSDTAKPTSGRSPCMVASGDLPLARPTAITPAGGSQPSSKSEENPTVSPDSKRADISFAITRSTIA